MKDLVHCEGQKRNRRMRNRDIEIEQKALLKTERKSVSYKTAMSNQM